MNSASIGAIRITGQSEAACINRFDRETYLQEDRARSCPIHGPVEARICWRKQRRHRFETYWYVRCTPWGAPSQKGHCMTSPKHLTSHLRRRTSLPLTVLSTLLAGSLSLSACGNGDDSDDGTGGSTSNSGGRTGSGGSGASNGSGGRTATGGFSGGGEGGAGLGGEGGSAGPASADDCDDDNGGIDLPDGFCAVVAAENLGRARHVAVSPSGDVFVAVNPSPDGATAGKIVALRDTDDDAKLDRRVTFNTTGGNGIAWRDGELFFAEADRIIKYELPDGQLEPSEDPEVVVAGLPDDGDHISKTIAFNDDVMYVNFGSATNSCQVNNRELESPGDDPCEELEERAGIWTFDASEEDQTVDDGERYAKGTRNMNALAIQPGTGDLWGVQNGRDQLAENWPAYFDEDDDRAAPSEELLRLTDGETYGWPYCYHDQDLGMVLAPEYGGDGLTIGACGEYPEPDFAFPAHWAPLGAVFYDGEHFPEEYQGGLFVAFHGSRFEPNATGDLPGYQVSFLPFDDDEPGDDFETFASGFAGDERPLPDEAESRPVGVTLAPDGSLYISDDYGGKLWRVFYNGD